MNILQCMASVPPEIIICVLDAVRWASGSSVPVKTIFGVMKLVSKITSMIACKTGMGRALAWMVGPRSPVEHSLSRCRSLRNSLLALRSSSLLARDTSSSALNWSCLSTCSARTSAMSLSLSALDVVTVSWRAQLVSMSYCMVGLSLPSGPARPCLVFLITPKSLSTTAGGTWFYRASWAPNVFVGWPSRRLTLKTSSDSVYLCWNLLFPFVTLERGSVET